jgi:hypothetical protein
VVVDVVVEGVSLLITNRSEVDSIVGRVGIDGLLREMRSWSGGAARPPGPGVRRPALARRPRTSGGRHSVGRERRRPGRLPGDRLPKSRTGGRTAPLRPPAALRRCRPVPGLRRPGRPGRGRRLDDPRAGRPGPAQRPPVRRPAPTDGDPAPPPCSGWGDAPPFTLALAARVPDPAAATRSSAAWAPRPGWPACATGQPPAAAGRSCSTTRPYAVTDPAVPRAPPRPRPGRAGPRPRRLRLPGPRRPGRRRRLPHPRARGRPRPRRGRDRERHHRPRRRHIPLRPGTVRLVHYFDRLPDGAWGYYLLLGLATSPDSARTYTNRTAALFRHLAGLPPEGEPPVWP